jgi:hypothetical protein
MAKQPNKVHLTFGVDSGWDAELQNVHVIDYTVAAGS